MNVIFQFNEMKLVKIIMSNGNEYEVIWDANNVKGNFYRMVDVKKGWVYINKNYISERYTIGRVVDNKEKIHPKIREVLNEYYGEELFHDD